MPRPVTGAPRRLPQPVEYLPAMCSIFCLLDLKSDPAELRRRALDMSRPMRHRGPDWSGIHTAPGAEELHTELLRKLENLHWYDCLRANKAMAAWGVEARVPFLDKRFLDVAMTIAPRDKLCGLGVIEKKVLRECFADLLPASVAWRQKEQFSDGVGYGWIDALKATAAQVVTDEVFADRAAAFPLNTPPTKEAYFYRAVFEQHFGGREAVLRTVPYGRSVACSTEAALSWDPSLRLRDDPSGRAVPGVHADAYEG